MITCLPHTRRPSSCPCDGGAVVAVVPVAGHVVEHVVDRRVVAAVAWHGSTLNTVALSRTRTLFDGWSSWSYRHCAVRMLSWSGRSGPSPTLTSGNAFGISLLSAQPQQRRVAVRPRARRAVVRPRVLVRRPADPGELDVLGVAEPDAVGEPGAAEDPAVGGRDRLAAGAEQAARAAPVLAEERLVVDADVVAQVLLVGDRRQVVALLLLRQRRPGRVGEEVLVRGLDAQDRVPRGLRVRACARGTPSSPATVAGSSPANGPALRAAITWSLPNSAAGNSSRW